MSLIVGYIFALVVIYLIIANFTDSNQIAGVGTFIIAIVLALGMLWYFNNTAVGARYVKSFDSNVSGGLERTVEVYDYNGQLIKEYEGKIDIKEDGEAGKTLFDLNGKRSIIKNAIVIIDEK